MKLPEFDELVQMAKNNPEQFEELRETLIEDVISSARSSSQRRLRGLQFQIDVARKKAKTPLAACIQISSMMHESFAELRLHLNDPWRAPEPQNEAPVAAKILSINEFKTRDSRASIA